MTKQVILRHAKDDFEALMVTQGMEDAGADVISAVWNGKPDTVLAFFVIAKYESPVTPVDIDAAINRRLFPGEGEHREE